MAESCEHGEHELTLKFLKKDGTWTSELDSDSDSSLYEYCGCDLYDPSSLAFQVLGHGGYGYDTSHVKADDPEPEIVKAARMGDLDAIKKMVLSARVVRKGAKDSDRKLRLLLNRTRRWTDIDYRMSGFTREHEWHDVTAVAAAALEGHADVVHFLLMSGADPTLEGCPDEASSLQQRVYCHDGEVYDNAFKAAEECAKDKPGRDLVNQMLAAVKPFWTPAEYGKARYDKTRATKGFPNWPKDFQVMRDALRDVWAKAEDEKQSVIATDVNANIPKLLEGKGDGQLMAAMDQMSIKGGEDGQAKAPLFQDKVKSDFSGRRNILPKGLNPFDKQEMLRAIRAKEEEKKNLVGPSDENLNQNKSQEAKEDTQEVSPAEKHKRFRSMELGHSKPSEFGAKLLALVPECPSGSACTHAQWNLRETFDAAMPEPVRKGLSTLNFSLDQPQDYFRHADELAAARERTTAGGGTRDNRINGNGVCWKHQRFGHRSWDCAVPEACRMGRPAAVNAPKLDRNGFCWKHQRYGYRSWACAAPGICIWSMGPKNTFRK